MYKTRAKRDAKGRVVHEDLQSKELPSTRIQPDRRWFGNTRVVGVRQLEQFREDMGVQNARLVCRFAAPEKAAVGVAV